MKYGPRLRMARAQSSKVRAEPGRVKLMFSVKKPEPPQPTCLFQNSPYKERGEQLWHCKKTMPRRVINNRIWSNKWQIFVGIWVVLWGRKMWLTAMPLNYNLWMLFISHSMHPPPTPHHRHPRRRALLKGKIDLHTYVNHAIRYRMWHSELWFTLTTVKLWDLTLTS